MPLDVYRKITPEREVTPYFQLPDLNRAGPTLPSVCSKTEVRMGPANVELLGCYSNTPEHLKRMKRTLDLVARPTVPRSPTRRPFVHKVSQRLDPAVLDQLVADYQAGIPTTELTFRYGIGKGTVLRILAARGVEMRHQPMSDEQIITAVQLYEAGASLKQIGSELNADHETVRKVLKRSGVQIRKPWERP